MSLSRVILNLDDSESALRVKTLGVNVWTRHWFIRNCQIGSCTQRADYCYQNTTLYLEKYLTYYHAYNLALDLDMYDRGQKTSKLSSRLNANL
jgi:hypothetical protein